MIGLATLTLASSQFETNCIPQSFPVQEVSEYSVRCLATDGNDTVQCLEQSTLRSLVCSNTELDFGGVQCCKTLRYSLTGEHMNTSSASNVIVLVLNGSYEYGNRREYRTLALRLNDSHNILIRSVSMRDEVVFKCEERRNDTSNNFFFENSDNIALYGITLTGCGPYTAGISLANVINVIISNCIFRCVVQYVCLSLVCLLCVLHVILLGLSECMVILVRMSSIVFIV